MHDILSKSNHRNYFALTILLITLLVIITRIYVIPYYENSLEISGVALFAVLLDNLLFSLFITVLIGGFLFWITPAVVKKSVIDVVEPKEISNLLKNATLHSKTWYFKGACGRYTRSTTIPKMAEGARNDGFGRDITIFLLNPKNNEICSAYANYRSSLKSGKKGPEWTMGRVKEEIIATAVTALKFQYEEPLLRIKVFFVDNFSAFRLDVSDSYVVVTKEEKEAAALKADSGTYFYESYKDDLRLTERQAQEMKCCGKLVFQKTINEKKLDEAIACANIIDSHMYTDINLNSIVQLINSPENPY